MLVLDLDERASWIFVKIYNNDLVTEFDRQVINWCDTNIEDYILGELPALKWRFNHEQFKIFKKQWLGDIKVLVDQKKVVNHRPNYALVPNRSTTQSRTSLVNYISTDEFNDIAEWLVINIKDPVIFESNTFYFKSKEDAMLFKLTWC